jgi:hypothetical protein
LYSSDRPSFLPSFRFLRFSLAVAACLCLLTACRSETGRVEAAVSSLSRAISEGDWEGTIRYLGGDLFLRTKRVREMPTLLAARGEKQRTNGVVFVETYVKSTEVDEARFQARIRFLAKYGRGSRTWTVNHDWTLEFIDGTWRVINGLAMGELTSPSAPPP